MKLRHFSSDESDDEDNEENEENGENEEDSVTPEESPPDMYVAI